VYIAYAKGFCDDKHIAITNDNLTFKQQVRYLVKRRQPELWFHVLVSNNLHHLQLINQVGAIDLLLGQFFITWADYCGRSPSRDMLLCCGDKLGWPSEADQIVFVRCAHSDWRQGMFFFVQVRDGSRAC
jgi:hypothetical protein